MGALSAVHPGLLAALALVALPILIHFFYRRRAKILRFSAMRYVLLSHKKVARKLLLKEYLLLALRCLIVAFLALAAARPLLSRPVKGLQLGDQPAALALVLDNSFSLLRKNNGTDLFHEAKRRAAAVLDQLGPLDRAALLLTASDEETALVGDRDELRRFLEAAEIAYGPSRPLHAVRRAAQLLKGAPEPLARIILITDLQRAGFDSGDGFARGETLPPVGVMDVAPEAPAFNLAVTGLELAAATHDQEEALAVRAKVRNYSDRAVERALVQIELGGENAGQGFVDLPPGEEAEKEFFLHARDRQAAEGILTVSAGDDLEPDNRAYFHLSGGGQVRALIVDGDPKTLLFESETFFLDQALNPRLYAHSRVEPTTVTPAELETQALEGFQVLALANVEKISPAAVAKIERFVREGGGLLFTLGDRINADDYDRLFGDLLPRELRGVNSPYAGGQSGDSVRVMHLDSLFGSPAAGEERHPLLGVFGGPDQGDLALANFTTFFVLQQELAPQSRVILRLTDGSPIMVEKNHGQGKVILFASSADRAWNDLCIRPTFLPLMQQTVQYLAGALFTGDPGRMTVGQEIMVPCPPDRSAAVVLGPAGRTELLQPQTERGQKLVRLARTRLPGFYYLKFLERLPEGQPAAFPPLEADRVLVINLPLEESDPARIGESELARLLPAEGLVVAKEEGFSRTAGGQTKTSELARGLLIALALAAAFELALVRKG